MKKIAVVLLTLACLFLSGCSTEFAKEEYNDTAKIVQKGDMSIKINSTQTSTNTSYTLKAGEFDGREELWSIDCTDPKKIGVDVSLKMESGTAKIVHIDSDDNVKNLMEFTSETSSTGSTNATVSLTKGKNRFKLVGYECKNIEVKLQF